MPAIIDRDYFLRRAAVERSRAAMAAQDSARRVHLELADRYHALLVEQHGDMSLASEVEA